MSGMVNLLAPYVLTRLSEIIATVSIKLIFFIKGHCLYVFILTQEAPVRRRLLGIITFCYSNTNSMQLDDAEGYCK
jgi:hypothetical protein